MNFEEVKQSRLLPDAVAERFMALGDMQRGEPEMAMLRVQHYMGGGVLSPVVEHVGDLTHRMTEHADRGEYLEGIVLDKVKKGLRYLLSEYGFEREMEENIQNNEISHEKLTSLLNDYANAHANLPAYNAAHYAAREAAVAIGRQEWDRAILFLDKIKDMIETGKYQDIVSSYQVGPAGNLKLYESKVTESKRSYRTGADEEHAIEIARDKFINYFRIHPSPAIYRGLGRQDPSSPINIVNPRAMGRASANTSNEYTVLMSELPSWSAYPKRSQSIICSNSEDVARSYALSRSNLCAVILPDSFRLGVCSEHDIWDSFFYAEKKLSESGSGDLGEALNFWIGQITGKSADRNTTLEDIKQGFHDFELSIKAVGEEYLRDMNIEGNALAQYITNIILNNPSKSAFDVLTDLFHPTRNEFELITSVTSLPSENEYGMREVWTDSVCLMLPAHYYSEFREKVLS